MRTRAIVTTALAVFLLSLAAPAPAHAVTYAETSAEDVTVRYNDCRTTKVRTTGDWDSDVYNDITVTIYNPNGRRFESDYFYDDPDGSVTTPVTLCQGDRKGRYKIEVEVVGYDENYDETSSATAHGGFRYRHIEKASSRINRRVVNTPERKYKWVVPGRLLRKGHGYRDRRVTLQAGIDGYWYDIDSARTNRRGYVAWQFKPNRFRWRYVFSGNATTKPSKSDAFRTPFRGSGRMSHSTEPNEVVRAGNR